MTAKERVVQFIKQEVPPSGTAELRAWKEKCRALGQGASRFFVVYLKKGNDGEQYAALQALRILGHEATGHGYGKELYYTVKVGAKMQKIRPEQHAVTA